MWIFLALLVVPLIEIGLFIEVGDAIGTWPTIGLVVLTAIVGTYLLRAQGVAALLDLQSRIRDGRDPTATLAHGAMILVAGVVLLTPGFFTDAIGFALLVPPVRAWLMHVIGQRVTIVQAGGKRRTGAAPDLDGGGHHGAPRARDMTIDGEFVDLDPDRGPEEQQDGSADAGPGADTPRRRS